MNKYIRAYFFIFPFLLSFTISSKSSAANSLSGIVKDSKGIVLQGVIIEIPDLKVGTSTDSNGHYFLDNLPAGKFIAIASQLSFAKTTITVNISGSTRLDFVLSESAIEGKEVVITGQSKATEIDRSPIPIVAINAQYLQQNISSNIIDALVEVPGVAAVTTGPNISKPFIRGLGYNRVLTLYDGMRQEGQQWGDEHGIEVDEYSIDRVELIKGPASLIYGSDALAGVVNLIPTPPAPVGKVIGDFTSEYQSNNNLIGGSGMMSGNYSNGFYWIGRVSHKQAMDYQDPIDGRVYATNYNETDASASFGIKQKWGNSHIDLAVFDDLQAIPDGSRDSATRQFTKQITEIDTFRPVVTNKELNTYALPALHQHVQHYRAFLSNNFNVLNGLLAVNVGFEHSTREEFSHPLFTSTPGLDLQLNTYTYDVKYYFHSIAGWEVTAGVNGMYQTNNATQGTDFVIPSYQQFDIGPFAIFKKTIGKLDIAGGVRFDSRTFHNNELYASSDSATATTLPTVVSSTYPGADKIFSDYSHTFSGMTYSLGFAYIFSKKFALKANVARGFRAPNIAEISANGVHPGTDVYQIGNADLKPEFSLQEDIGAEFTTRHISATVSVFNNSITNYIFNQKLDTTIVAGNETFKYSASNARLYGGEASIDIHPHPLDWLHFENTISLVYALNEGGPGIVITDQNRYLPQIPPVHGTSELRGNFKHPAKYLKNSFAKVQVVMYATQNRVYLTDNTETPTPGYTLVNAGLGSDITNRAGKTMFNISLFGNNIFNVAYQDALSRLKYFEEYPTDPRGHLGIYNMGRNVGVKLSIPFDVI